MKKLILLLVLTLNSLVSIAQQIALSDKAVMEPPKKMRKLSKAEIESVANQRFSKTRFLIDNIKNSPNQMYQIDDMVIFINTSESSQTKPIHGYLKKLKLATDNVHHSDKSYSSSLEAVGDKNVFIMNHIMEGINLYRFFTINKAEEFVVNGYVQYNAGDEVKARSVLEDVIKGIKFKE
jgi:hypothetical protein